MICPRWVYTRIQPIAIQNVLDYLVAALQQPDSAGRIIEIGGEDVLSYGGLMETYASVRGLKRYLLPVPFLTPRLSSYWVRLVTPFSVSLVRPLIEGLRNEVIVRGNAGREIFPEVQLLDCKTAQRNNCLLKSYQLSGSGVAIPPGIRKWLQEECALMAFSGPNDEISSRQWQ
jgi:hypothetical protein